MTIELYRNLSDSKVVDKKITLLKTLENVKLLDEFDILNPRLKVSRETFSYIIEIETESPYPTKAPRLVIFTFCPHNSEIKISSPPGGLLIFRRFCLRQAVPEKATVRDPQGRVWRSGTYKPCEQKPENHTLPVGRRIFILSVILNIRSKLFLQ